jgi:hypothetical protein
MDSAEIDRLSDRCERLKRVYGAAVSRLFAIGYAATPAEYREMRISVDDARRDLQTATYALENLGSSAPTPGVRSPGRDYKKAREPEQDFSV